MPETPARPVTTDIEVRAADGISSHVRDIARRKIQALERRAGDRDLIGHITLRRASDHRFVADASVTFEGRVLAAHAGARSPEDAVDAVIARLERQMRRVVDADVALRNEPRVINAALEDLRRDPPHRPAKLKPPEKRQIVHRRTYRNEPIPTLTAIADMLDDDLRDREPELALDDQRHRPGRDGLLGEVVAVAREARDAEEQRSRRHLARVVGEVRDLEIAAGAAVEELGQPHGARV